MNTATMAMPRLAMNSSTAEDRKATRRTCMVLLPVVLGDPGDGLGLPARWR